MPEYHILNLGAGVQSTAVYLMNMEGKFLPRFDAAIFADTKWEPEAVYTHLAWLKKQGGPKILVRTKGSLGEHLMKGVNSTGQRFASIPAFTSMTEGSTNYGRVQRQCTKEYKTEVIDRCIRREILGLKPRQRVPKGVTVYQYFGISWDERQRAYRIHERALEHKAWLEVVFPLIELLRPPVTRWQCEEYLKPRVPHKVTRSACVFCPFQDDEQWQRIKGNPQDWNRAVQIDEALRIPGNVVNRKMNAKLYLHETCKPITKIDFDIQRLQGKLGFKSECGGGCGV